MNPWRLHPAVAGLPIPERHLPPARSWRVAQGLGITGPDGSRGTVAANPERGGFPGRRMSWAGGPTPPPIKRLKGRLIPPGDATETVYLWLTRQASLRLHDVQANLLSGGRHPSVDELAFRYTVETRTVASWIKATRAKAKELGIRVADLEVPQPQPFTPRELQIPEGVTFFASGAEGSPGDVEGIARIADNYPGIGVGVEIQRCGSDCRRALSYVAERKSVPIFVDSGAFTAHTQGQAIDDVGWRKILADYLELARAFKARASLVAPDVIGSQSGTKGLLDRYGRFLAQPSRSHRSWILVAAQKGRVPRHVFWADMRALLVHKGVARKRIVAAIPLKAKATTLAEVKAFARHFGADVGRYHLLGRSPLHPTFGKTLKAIWDASPVAEITCDATTLVAGLRGKPELLGVVPRVYTYAQDIVRYELMFEAFQKSYRGKGSLENWVREEGWADEDVPDYTDNIAEIGWLPPRYRRILAQWIKIRSRRDGPGDFDARSEKLLVEWPSEWLASPMYYDDPGGPKWYDDAEVAAWLDDQWVRFLGSYYSATIKRDGLVKAWRASLAHMRELVPGIDAAIDQLAFF